MSKFLLLWCIVAPAMLFAQGNNDWQLGGNDNGGSIWEVRPINNFFGTTNITNNLIPVQPVRMGTNSISRIFMSTSSAIIQGSIGIGNDFVTPQSRLHLFDSQQGNMFRTEGPGGIENRWSMFTGATGTGGFGTERFRLFVRANESIVRFQATQPNTNQLQLPIPANPTPNSAITFNVGNNWERMRITHTHPTNDIHANHTRVGISANLGGGIIVNPVSTLHIGNRAFFDAAGHRAWMNVGTYYNYGATDNMYVGLRESEERPSLTLDNLDAIIDWGDNDVSVPLTSLQPTDMYEGDHLRIIFTANKAGTHPAQTDRGLELMRFIPDGYVGIGNAFNANMEPVRRLEILEDDLTAGDQPQFRLTHTKVNNGFNTGRFVDFQATGAGDLAILPFDNTTARRVGIGVATPTNTVDINGDLRIRQIANDENLTRILVADNNGVVHWRDANNLPSGPGIVTANNGLSISGGPNNVQLGGTLIQNTLIESRGRTLGIGDGYNIASLSPARLHVQSIDSSSIVFTSVNSGISSSNTLTAGYFESSNRGSTSTAISTPGYNGVEVLVDPGSTLCNNNALFYGSNQTTNAIANYGIKMGMYGNNLPSGESFGTSIEMYGNTGTNLANYGNYVRLYGNNASAHNIGILSDVGFGSSSPIRNIGVLGSAGNVNSSSTCEAIGVSGTASSTNGIAYGIYGGIGPAGNPLSRAAYFSGTISVAGTDYTSDQMFKTNVDTIANVKNIISQLQPKTFFYDTINYDQFHFSSKRQYGLIAQHVETVLPELVRTGYHIPVRDSAGTVIKPAVTYKELNYNAFIAILIAGMQKQQAELDSVKSLLGMSKVNSGSSGSTTGYVKPQHITLSNLDALVLDQNVPNPFEENTLITYRIPENIQNAYIIFYDQNGRVINKADITTRGEGKLQVYGSQLSKGIYTYSLVADGKVIDTKKMVKQ